MKYSKDIGFAVIYRDIPIDSKLTSILKKACEVNYKVYKKKPKKFRIFLCDTNAMYKKKASYYWSPAGTATVLRNNDLVTKSPELIDKIGIANYLQSQT